MPKSFFSIIIPTLNEEDYIGRLLTNLDKQTNKDFEVIVVDGKSDDKTCEVINKFKTQLSLKLLTTSKRNVSFQRNSGAKEARGEYLVFFDADVQIGKRFFSQLTHQLQIHKGKLYTTKTKADSKDFSDQLIANLFNLCTTISITIEKQFVPGFNFIVDKKVFLKSGGFNENIKHAEDHELSLRLMDAGYILIFLPYPRYEFSLRRYRQEGRLTILRKNAQALLHILTKGPITEDLFYYPMGGGWYKTANKIKKENGLEKAEKYIRKFMKIFVE